MKATDLKKTRYRQEDVRRVRKMGDKAQEKRSSHVEEALREHKQIKAAMDDLLKIEG
jgi:hypothetical protein